MYAQNFLMPCILSGLIISYPKNISAVKKGELKKVQVTKLPEGVMSLWGQEETARLRTYIEFQHAKQLV